MICLLGNAYVPMNASIAAYCVLSQLLDKHAPQREYQFVERPLRPWINNEIKEANRKKRYCEKT